MSRKINLKTEDNVVLSADYYPLTEQPKVKAVVLLHMMPAVKGSWNDFAKKLNKEGYQCLAIDLRGHGESEGGPKGYKNFSDSEHQLSIKDAEAAVDFFIDKGVAIEHISLVGASIGANLSLQMQSEHPAVKASVLLSPGLDYYGIETESASKKLTNNQFVFMVAGGEDDEYSTETVEKLSLSITPSNTKIQLFEKSGHGTMIFNNDPSFMDEVINWLKIH